MSLKIEKDGFCELGRVNPVVVTKLSAGHGGLIDVKCFGTVIRARFEDICSVGEEVVQGRQHLYTTVKNEAWNKMGFPYLPRSRQHQI